jgi:mono/diheme cytochrome c family protein
MIMFRELCAAGILLAAAGTGWAQDGARIFKDQCAKCHGDTGKSDTSMGKKMNVAPIAGDAKIAATSDEDLAQKILAAEKHPKPVKKMAAGDVAGVAAYVKALASGK